MLSLHCYLNRVHTSLHVLIPQQVFDHELTVRRQEAESAQVLKLMVDQSVGKTLPITKQAVGHGIGKQKPKKYSELNGFFPPFLLQASV